MSESLLLGDIADGKGLLIREAAGPRFEVEASLSRDISQFEVGNQRTWSQTSVDTYTGSNDGPCRRFLVTVVSKAVRKAVQKNAYLRREVLNPVLLPYGSVKTRLALPCSDIDLVLTGVQGHDDNRQEVLLTIAECIDAEILAEGAKKKRNKASIGAWVDEVFVIPSETMPLLMLQSSKILKSHTIQVDITVQTENHTGIPTVVLVERYLDDAPKLRQLMLVLKQLLRNGGLNKPFSGGLASYSLFLMAAAFVAQEDPSLSVGRLLLRLLAFYSGCDLLEPSVTIANKNVAELVASFDPTTMSIVLPSLKTPEITAIHRDIPPRFQTNPQHVVIIDPCNTSNNVGRPTFQFPVIQQFMRHLYLEFTVRLCHCCPTRYEESQAAMTTTCRNILKRALYLSTLWPRDRGS